MTKGKYTSESEDERDYTSLNFKQNPINNKSDLNNINYLVSEHVKDLQQSQYIKFENDVEKIRKHNNRVKEASLNRETFGINNN